MVRSVLLGFFILVLWEDLFHAAGIWAQDIPRLQSSVVRVSPARPGTGFIVHLENDAARVSGRIMAFLQRTAS